MTQQSAYFPMGDGLDLRTPAITKKPGAAIAGENYEPRPEGYRRIDGHERYDGRPEPHKASYSVLNFDAGTAAISEGSTVTGATSGATGVALIDGVVESGSYGGGDADGYLVLGNVTGIFQDDENLQVSAATKCVADGTASDRGAANDNDDTTWIRDAIETRRSAIGKVPGSGIMRGVWFYGGNAYAFRNNAGSTECKMHKSTSSGWSECDLGHSISFDAGSTEFTVDGTLTGGTSGATATIKRVIVSSGSWDDNDAAGRLILYSVTGTFQNNETITDGSGGSATADGANAANTLQPSGRFEFQNYNFYGHSGSLRMYGCDGVSNAFEWDGSVFVPIVTGMTTDTPAHLICHKNHLFLGFAGGSWQHSSLGNPIAWNPVTGAAELGMGDEITGGIGEYAGVAVLFARNRTAILYGTNVNDWTLETISHEVGAIEWSVQHMAQPTVLDDRGVRALGTTQAFGDFRAGTLTENIWKLLERKRSGGITLLASLRVRKRDQYRLYFSDGSGLVMDLSGKDARFMPLNYGKTVYCCCSAEISSGEEILLFGSDDGYVYRLDVGTSFDDENLEAFFRLAFNHQGSPTQIKRYHKATVETDAAPNSTLSFSAEFSYGSSKQPAMSGQDFDVEGGGGFWDEANWNEFYWDAPAVGLAEARLFGEGTNISLAIWTEAKYEQSHTIHGVTLHFSPRRIQR